MRNIAQFGHGQTTIFFHIISSIECWWFRCCSTPTGTPWTHRSRRWYSGRHYQKRLREQTRTNQRSHERLRVGAPREGHQLEHYMLSLSGMRRRTTFRPPPNVGEANPTNRNQRTPRKYGVNPTDRALIGLSIGAESRPANSLRKNLRDKPDTGLAPLNSIDAPAPSLPGVSRETRFINELRGMILMGGVYPILNRSF